MRGIQIRRLRGDPRHGGPGQGDLGLVVCAGVGKAGAGAVEQAAGIESVFGNINAGRNLAYLSFPLLVIRDLFSGYSSKLVEGRGEQTLLWSGKASLLAGNSFSSCEQTREKSAAVL